MSDLRTAAQQALQALKNNAGEMRVEGAISILETALAQQAEPTGKQPLQVESAAAVAEIATTQQRDVETPPSDYRRGYWDGFNIGKREGRIEAEDAAKQAEPVEPVAALIAQRDALLVALKMIAGETPCFDNLMGDKDIARAAIKAVEETK